MALRPASKTVSSLTGVLVLAAVLWLLLNFVYAPSCGRFSCSYEPAWIPIAHADSGGCPDALSEAMVDASWAADRLDGIAKKKVTAGLFYDPDGMLHEFDSSQNEDSRRAWEVGRDAGVFDPRGPSFLVDHVEVKVAAAMRDSGTMTGVLVINKTDGPCGRNRDGTIDQGSCLSVVPQLLPVGAKLVVWWPGKDGSPVSTTFVGGQS
ncbi:DddA-like double-stranded DNA deaminase toxin [Labedaea rhizosphaerae]|uniref:Nucleic acid/nucleotide deaminase of polymorphic system toxin n=1 Tax=Labedaea rhizosphaerae TaxID=598644 RepID=A0A4R6S9Y1_LABRH|nr:DddA-like double-stranded DNA deaminase toxin [Labedaea rhizosphaerae]TDP96710.1 nucleic acid/nucleotide deaminase of polymorphic system toxin [Labedaea rhizosphaerae]